MQKRLCTLVAGLAVAVALPATAAPAAGGAAAPGAGLHPGKQSFFAPPPASRFPLHGPRPIPRPNCKARQIKAVAYTELSPNGVLGVVELEGTKFYHVRNSGHRRCGLPIAKGPRRLIAADGTPLAVPRGRADKTNPGSNIASYYALANGKASWGFGWFGSYCGAAPRYIVMKIIHGRTLDVPFYGPTPPCPGGAVEPVTSTLTDGSAGGPGSAVQPAPPAYLNLTTSARFLGTTTRTRPARVEVTISDTSDQPVLLVPCPEYLVQTDDSTAGQEQFGSAVSDGSTPGCKKKTLTVQPDQPVTFRVSREELNPGTTFGAPQGSTFDVQVLLAGMPTAEVSTTVQ